MELKSTLFALLLIFSSGHLLSQTIEWEKIKTNYGEELHQSHYTKSGHIIGQLRYPQQVQISADKGTSWTMDSIPDYTFITERSDGLTLLNKSRSYNILDTIENKLQPLTLEMRPSARNLYFLDNNMLVIATFDGLFFYDNDFQFLDSISVNLSGFNITKTNGELYAAFISKDGVNTYYDLDVDAFSLTERCTIPDTYRAAFSFTENFMTYIDGVYYFNKHYTSDLCGTWSSYPFDFSAIKSEVEHVNPDGGIYYISGLSRYYTPDFGVTTLPLNQYVQSLDQFLFADGGTYVMQSGDCPNEIFLTENYGMTWDTISMRIGSDESGLIEVSNDGLVIADLCSYQSLESNNPNSSWQTINLDPEASPEEGRYLALGAGRIVHISEYSAFLSLDNGQTWEDKNFVPYFSNFFLRHKSDFLVAYLQTEVPYFSLNEGESWEIGTLPDDVKTGDVANFFSPQEFITEDGSVVSYHNTITNESYDFEHDGLLLDANRNDIYTSFHLDKLYIIGESNNDTERLFVSEDKGKSFIMHDIPFEKSAKLEVDNFGNVYIWKDNKIFISINHGGTWIDISPPSEELVEIIDLDSSPEGYIYLATIGCGILKTAEPVFPIGQINVTTYLDENKNCVRDATEPILPFIKIELKNDWTYLTDKQGERSLYLPQGSWRVLPILNNDLFETCESQIEVDVTVGTVSKLEIPVMVKQECIKAEASIGTPLLRRCFDNSYVGHFCNEGSKVLSNRNLLIYLDSYFEEVTSSLPIVGSTDSTIILELPELNIFECVDFSIDFKLSCDSELGEQHCIKMEYEDPESCDEIIYSYEDCQENIGSFDPNDITIYADGLENQEYVLKDQQLEYRIRFQNTGTDTAFNIRIVTQIDSLLKVSAIKPVASSHDYTYRYNQKGLLEIYFDNIMLVDSTANNAGSQGFIKYQVELKENAKAGDVFFGAADIYFDYNEPITTNVSMTTVAEDIDEDGFHNFIDCNDADPDINPDAEEIPGNTVDENCDGILTSTFELPNTFIDIYPNPTIDYINIDVRGFLKFQSTLYDLTGQQVKAPSSDSRIQIDSLPTGVYLLEVKDLDSGQKLVERIVIGS